MASPKSKISRARRGMRRSHNALTKPTIHNCKNCGSITKPHTVCLSCGHYDDKEVITARV